MGEQFAIIFDIAIAAIVVCRFFVGWRNGFVKVVLGSAATIAAFLLALLLSAPISGAIYNGYIDKPLSEKVDETVDKSLSALHIGDFSGADFSRAEISGTPVGEIVPEYSGTASAVFDLTSLNLTYVGLTDENLNTLGLTDHPNLSNLNAKTAEFTRADIEKYGLGKLVFAQFAAECLIKKGDFADFNSFLDVVKGYLPGTVSTAGSDSVTVSLVRRVVLNMLESKSTVSDTVMNNMVRPYCTVLIRSVVFAVIFAAAAAGIRIAANASKILEKLPVIGKANSFLGGIAGLLRALVDIFLVCLATRLAVSLFDGSTLIFNQTTIDSTLVFKKFYYMSFLDFLT